MYNAKQQEFIEYFKTLTLRQQADMIAEFRDIRRENFNATYKTVDIYHGSTNITHHIRKITGFDCYHQPSQYDGCIGTNVVMVPRELYTNELERELIKFFNHKDIKGFTLEAWHTVLENVINS